MKSLNILALSIALSLSYTQATAQVQEPGVVWEGVFPDPEGTLTSGGNSTIVDSGGNIVTVGSNGYESPDVYFLKTSPIGEVLQRKHFGSADANEVGFDVQELNDRSGYIVAGKTNDGNNMYLAMLDREGEVVWEKSYGGFGVDVAQAVRQISGGFILFGFTNAFGLNVGESGVHDGAMVKVDQDGNFVWRKTFGGTASDLFLGGIVTSDGGFLAFGESASFRDDLPLNQRRRVWLVKTDSEGVRQWQQTYEGWQTTSVKQTFDEGYAFVAGFVSADDRGILLVKTDYAGEIQWASELGGDRYSYVALSLEITVDGGFVMAGTSKKTSRSRDDLYITRTDRNGTRLWEKILPYDSELYPQAGISRLQSVVVTSDGGYVASGFMRVSTSSFLYQVRLDSDGGLSPVTFMRGDANADGGVDITDAIFTLDFLFQGGGAPPCMDAADSNDDEILDISDAVFTLLFLYAGAGPMKAPYPGLGEDPTAGSGGQILDCMLYPPSM